jgi:PPM family protein phosphatase
MTDIELTSPLLTAVVTGVTHPGLVRADNQDSIGLAGAILTGHARAPLTVTVPLSQPVEFIVADGMGGHRGGAEASRRAIQALRGSSGPIEEALESVTAELLEAGAADPHLAGMATTVVGLRLQSDGTATVFNVGDSRCYRLIDGYLGQLSVDDRPPAAGVATQGVITQYLGGDRRIVLDAHVLSIAAGTSDRFLLCSDGLTDVVPDSVIGELLGLPAVEAVQALLAAALQAGAPDNTSIVVVDIVEGRDE